MDKKLLKHFTPLPRLSHQYETICDKCNNPDFHLTFKGDYYFCPECKGLYSWIESSGYNLVAYDPKITQLRDLGTYEEWMIYKRKEQSK